MSDLGGAASRAERFFATGDTEILVEGLDQVLLLPDACAVCGHEGVVFLRQEDGTLVCVDCITKQNRETNADHQVGPPQ